MTTNPPDRLEPLFYREDEVAQLLGVHRTTVRAQSQQKEHPLNEMVFYLTPSTRRYPREAIHKLAGFVHQTNGKVA